MTQNRLHEITSRLDKVFEASDKVKDDELKAYLSQYMCVLTSGYIEESFKILIREYVEAKSAPFVMNHVISWNNKITNLKCAKIGQLLNTFSTSWKDEFDQLLTDREKDAIDSVVANRHLIAHGRNINISYVQIKEWYKETKHAINKIKTIMQ